MIGIYKITNLITGRYYSDIPVYNKRNKRWK